MKALLNKKNRQKRTLSGAHWLLTLFIPYSWLKYAATDRTRKTGLGVPTSQIKEPIWA